MRIVVVTDLLRANGAGIMAATQASLLHKYGHDVTLLSGAAPDLAIRGIASLVKNSSFLPSDHLLDVRDSGLRRELGRAAVEWMLSQIDVANPDALILHNVGRLFNQVEVALLSQVRPVLFVLHDEWFFSDAHYVEYADGDLELSYEPHRARDLTHHDFDPLWEVPRTAERLLLVAPSQWLQGRVRSVFPTIPCFRVPYALDAELLKPVDRKAARIALGIGESAHVVGFVGHPAMHRKGYDILAKALATMSPRPVLLVAGGAEAYVTRDLREVVVEESLLGVNLSRASGERTRGLGKDDVRTIVLGPIAREKFANVISAMDLVVHPSRIDNLPTVPIESQFCGVVCVVSDSGGSAETVVERRHVFSPDISPLELGKIIVSLSDEARSETFVERMHRREAAMGRYAPELHVQRVEELLSWALEQ